MFDMILLGEIMKNFKEKFLDFFSNRKRRYWTIAISIIILLGLIGLIILSIVSKRYDYL